MDMHRRGFLLGAAGVVGTSLVPLPGLAGRPWESPFLAESDYLLRTDYGTESRVKIRLDRVVGRSGLALQGVKVRDIRDAEDRFLALYSPSNFLVPDRTPTPKDWCMYIRACNRVAYRSRRGFGNVLLGHSSTFRRLGFLPTNKVIGRWARWTTPFDHLNRGMAAFGTDEHTPIGDDLLIAFVGRLTGDRAAIIHQKEGVRSLVLNDGGYADWTQYALRLRLESDPDVLAASIAGHGDEPRSPPTRPLEFA